MKCSATYTFYMAAGLQTTSLILSFMIQQSVHPGVIYWSGGFVSVCVAPDSRTLIFPIPRIVSVIKLLNAWKKCERITIISVVVKNT